MSLILEELRQAHEDDKVVFFCGAGVSVPAGLPSFKGLVKQVLESLHPSREGTFLPWQAFDADRFDEALDILERRTGGGFGKVVREKVREILGEEQDQQKRHLDAHITLCRLAGLGKNKGRLITTNFDSLFEFALKKLHRYDVSIEIAPALSLPKPDAWHGLIYLHGKLDHSPDNKNLVLTTADFGKAYLLDGWARRVVVELFRHFYVVFIGYRIEDPTMRYLVSALAAAREDKENFYGAYAFAPYGEKTIGPWFKQVWPKHANARSEGASERLIWMAIETGDAFPDAVAAIEDLLCPEEWGHSLYKLNRSGLHKRFPSDAWKVINLIVGPETKFAGSNLPQTLDEIFQVTPAIAEHEDFKRLRARAR